MLAGENEKPADLAKGGLFFGGSRAGTRPLDALNPVQVRGLSQIAGLVSRCCADAALSAKLTEYLATLVLQSSGLARP